MTDLTSIHTPVLAARVVDLLAPALQHPGAVYVDCTLGMGGHAEAVLRTCPDARLVGIDRDEDALAIARARLADFADRSTLHHVVFDELDEVLATEGLAEVDAVFFDLGVSSLQLDEAARGFSYMQDAPLDMRMNQRVGTTAADILATASEAELRNLFTRYGEERLAGRYAAAIVTARVTAAIHTTGQLVAILQDATPAARRDAGHPAKRVFQALRIAVNGELDALEAALPQALAALRVGGRVAVEAYQSLEDRLVKHVFAQAATVNAPRGLPLAATDLEPAFRILTRGAEQAPDTETATNPRAKPVRLRAIERIRSTTA